MATATKAPAKKAPTTAGKKAPASKPAAKTVQQQPTRQSRRAATRRPASAPSQHPLHNLIPDAYFAEEYHSRLVGGRRDGMVIRKMASLKHNIIISGPTGSAKTSLIYAVAAGFTGEVTRKRVDGEMTDVNVIDTTKATPIVYIPCNGAVEPSQMIGRWTPQSNGSYKFVPGDLLIAVILGGIIYFDEVNFAPPKINAVMHGLLDKRRMLKVMDAAGAGLCCKCAYVNGDGAKTCSQCGADIGTGTDFKAHPNTQIIAAYNPDYEGTRPLNEAFLNRFACPMRFDYNPEVEKKMLWSDRLTVMAAQLRAQSDELRTPISTNMLVEFEEFALDEDLGFGFACENFLNKFHDDERPAVTKVLNQHTPAIRAELDDDAEADDVDWEMDADGNPIAIDNDDDIDN
jgi:hypothetical protein